MNEGSIEESRTRSGARRCSVLIIALAWFACPPGALLADGIYKSIDAEGHAVYSDRPDAASQPVVLDSAPPGPPSVLHFCWTNCFTLTLDDHGVYRRVDGSEETWTVERFTPDSVVLHRHDAPASWNGFTNDVVYAGQVADERLVRVTLNGHPMPDINMAWGGALDSLPGNNAERDQRASAQSATPPVEANAPNAADDAVAQEEIRTDQTPPPLLDDPQPPCAEDGSLWTPGYWAWGGGGFRWAAGAWVQPPRVGLLWTPGYWEFAGAAYVFHPGYWGPHVGFYGGIDYGFGYGGVGYAGGRWVGGVFAYNTTVNNVDVRLVHNTYTESVPKRPLKRVSYQGGAGGSTAVASAQERAAAAEAHALSTATPRRMARPAANDPSQAARDVSSRTAMTLSHPPAGSHPSRLRASGAAPSPAAPSPAARAFSTASASRAATSSSDEQSAVVSATHPPRAAAQPAAPKIKNAIQAKPLHP